MSFQPLFEAHPWDAVQASIYAKTAADVEQALAASRRTLEDFKALISPAAGPYLEQMAQRSHQLTRQRFGNTVQLYVPLYLSNECQNICTYCGFSLDNKIARRTLSSVEMLQEAAVLKEWGYDHVLLVTGEANQTVGVEYLEKALRTLRPHFAPVMHSEAVASSPLTAFLD